MKINKQEFPKNNQKKLIILMFINFFSLVTFAQEPKIAAINQLDEFVFAAKNIAKTTKPIRVENLINEIQQSVYVEFDGVKTYGIKPVSLFVNVKNISKINDPEIKKENIEIINIRINTFDDLKTDIDLSKISNFKNLKYIYIISEIRCNESDIRPIIKNIGRYIVLYKIASNS